MQRPSRPSREQESAVSLVKEVAGEPQADSP